jgi:hypothetical protein
MNLSFFIRHYVKRGILEKIARYDFRENFYMSFVMLNYKGKRELLSNYRKKYNLHTFIETGTFLGDTADAMKKYFPKIYTIELQPELAKEAIERFKNTDIEVLYGDSAKLLPGILSKINNKSILFWLDAHFSGSQIEGNKVLTTARGEKDTPILEELDIILKDGLGRNVILIDDARAFGHNNDYPTIKHLKTFLNERGVSNKMISIKNDIIRITPINSL